MSLQPSPDHAAAVENFVEELRQAGTAFCTEKCYTEADVKYDPETQTAEVKCLDCGETETRRLS